MIKNKAITGIMMMSMVLTFTITSVAAPNNNDIQISESVEADNDSTTAKLADASTTNENGTERYENRIIYAANLNYDKNSNEVSTVEAEEEAAEETIQEPVSVGSSVIAFAKQFLGGRYRYSGTSLTNGTDCSGFTMSVYKNFGISLPHSSRAQRNVGVKVGSLAEAKAGDIICYSGHVALYMGDGQVIHALNEKKGITISNANYNHILDIRRVV